MMRNFIENILKLFHIEKPILPKLLSFGFLPKFIASSQIIQYFHEPLRKQGINSKIYSKESDEIA